MTERKHCNHMEVLSWRIEDNFTKYQQILQRALFCTVSNIPMCIFLGAMWDSKQEMGKMTIFQLIVDVCQTW